MAVVELCDVDDVKVAVPFKAEVGDEELAVFKIGDKFYVIQNTCSHGPGSLVDGYVDGEEIECPFHRGRFNILTGTPTVAPCTIPLRTWDVTIRDGKICIDTDQHAAADT